MYQMIRVSALILLLWSSAWCADDLRRADEVCHQVDALMVSVAERAGVEPVTIASDAEFLRRVYLDLAGQVPSVSATRDFLASRAAEKRRDLVQQLLTTPKTFDHLAEVWRAAMVPSQAASPELLQNMTGLHNWLRQKFRDNFRYDRIVSDIVAASGTANEGPALFFTALDMDPKKLASSTARIFLGLQLECAQCHDHPFDDWKQDEFWGYAAFFARLPRSEGMMNQANMRLVDRRMGEVTLPDTEQVVLPKFPRGRKVRADEPGTRRQQLSIWMASPDNPYVARAAVNRVWALLFGRGLVDPVDDLGPHNPASHPEVLELLTEYFIETDYDLRNLLRTICATKTYQRTSQISSASPPPSELFAAMTVKVLTPEQLFDSLRSCLSQQDAVSTVPAQPFAQTDYRRLQFVSQMASRSGNATDFDRGLQQAWKLMNGAEIVGATDVSRSPLLMSLDAPFLSDDQRIDILYLATLSRYPTDAERARVDLFLADRANASVETARADVLWALLNSAEFSLNH